MEFPSLSKVKNHPKLLKYSRLCWEYLSYLIEKEDLKICLTGYDDCEKDLVFSVKPYMHRWRPEYMKARLAKFYLLDEWYKNNPNPLTMLTFTTYHDTPYARRQNGEGYTIEQSWEILKNGFRRATVLIRNKIRKNVSYFWIVEPQIESGYPHIHAGFFTEFTEEEKERLKNHWAKVVKAGDYKHGLDFSFGPNYKTGDMSSLRNYLMKYMGKIFIDGMKDWTPEEFVFNAIAWKEGYRFFGCSRDLSKVMKRKEKKNREYTWFSTSLRREKWGDIEEKVIRKNPGWKMNNG